MAKIEEYLPQVEAQGPVGGTSPMIEQISEFGRGVQDFGNAVEQGGDVLLRRQQQAEQSEASAAVSDARLQFSNQIDAQTADGTIDTKQVSDDYDDFVNKTSESLSTSGAQNSFQRQSSRLKAALLIKATRGQSIVAGKNAQSDFQNALNDDMSTVTNDPDQFPDVHDSNIERINDMVDNGLLPAAQKDQWINNVGKQLSQATIRGKIQQDYQSAVGQGSAILDSGGPDALPKAEALQASMGSFNTAQQFMDSGTFDKYLNSNDKKALSGELKVAQNGAYTEINRMATLRKAAAQEQAQAWEDQNFSKLKTAGLSTKDILKAPIPWQAKNEWINMAQASTKAQNTNPVVFNQFANNIVSGKVTDPYDVYAQVKRRNLSIPDAEKLVSFMDKTPEGQANMVNRKQLFDVAKSQLVKDGMTGLPDSMGQYKMAQFTQDLQRAEQNLRTQNLPVTSLYDTSSKDYFASPDKLQRYKQTPAEFLQNQAAQSLPGYKPPSMPYAPPGTTSQNTLPQAPAPAMVKMMNPGGKAMLVPKEKADDARKAGWKDR